jgi:hypothetical protein
MQQRSQSQSFFKNKLASANIILHKLQISVADIPRVRHITQITSAGCVLKKEKDPMQSNWLRKARFILKFSRSQLQE